MTLVMTPHDHHDSSSSMVDLVPLLENAVPWFHGQEPSIVRLSISDLLACLKMRRDPCFNLFALPSY